MPGLETSRRLGTSSSYGLSGHPCRLQARPQVSHEVTIIGLPSVAQPLSVRKSSAVGMLAWSREQRLVGAQLASRIGTLMGIILMPVSERQRAGHGVST